MSIRVKLTDEEIALVDILRHPVLGAEFIRNYDILPTEKEDYAKVWKEREVNPEYYYIHTDYQRQMLCDFNSHVSYCTGRAVGKTECLIDKINFYLINQFWPEEYVVFLAPSKVHVDPVFRKLRRWYTLNNFLKHLIDRRGVNSAQFTIKLLTGAFLDCRIAGTTGTGQNVIGLHTPVIILDEAGYFPWGTWQETLRCLNDWQEGYQMIVAGVPDGRRENSVLFYVDQKAEHFTKHRIPAHRNPRWTDEAEQRARDQFGGVESEDYIHMVLGQHGSPVWSIFDRARMNIKNYDIYIKKLYGTELKEDTQAGHKQILEMPLIPNSAEYVLFGIDLGYTDPTSILVLYLINDKWWFHARLNWIQVPYPKQEKLIAFLASKFNPHLIGVDEGSSGKSLTQHLLQDPAYQDYNFKNRLIPINFATSISIGKDEEGKDITTRTKEFAVPYVQEIVNTHRLVFSERDEEFITELERTTYLKTASGRKVFRTYTERGGLRGDDHNLSALLSAFMAWYLSYESLTGYTKRPKLFSARWIIA